MAIPQLDKLKGILLNSGIQAENAQLYQVIVSLIDYLRKTAGEVSAVTTGSSGSGGIFDQHFLTHQNDLVTLPQSRQLLPGTHVNFDDSVLGERTVDVDLAFIELAEFLTAADETGNFPNSRQLLAGLGITFDDTVPGERTLNSTGGGDVFGPAASVDENIAVFDGITGKLIKDGGASIADIIALIAAAAGITELTGDVTAGPGSGSQVATIADEFRTQQIGVTVDGGGVVLSPGPKGFKSFMMNGTIIGWRLMADQGGSVEFDIFKDAYASFPSTTSIVAAAPPEIVADTNAEDTTLAGWDTTVNAGDVFAFEIVSAATIQRVTLELTIRID